VEPDATRAETKVLVVKLDPRTLKLATGADERVVISISNATSESNRPTLWMGDRSFVISSARVEGAESVVSGVAQESPEAADAVAAIGVEDDGGMLVYVEVQEGRRAGADAGLLSGLLEKLSCSSRLLLTRPLLPSFG
jgi:hypothetical protein